MQAVLVRVGIDSSKESGSWNAPVNAAGEFAYVPILEDEKKRIRPEYEQYARMHYEQLKDLCEKLGGQIPHRLCGRCAHLDPDFEHLTYGDEHNKGKRLWNLNLGEGDILAFYAGLRPSDAGPGGLIYALIGLYVLAGKPKRAEDILEEDWHKNAHTRRYSQIDDIVFFGEEGVSGRLERCIPIGGWRDGAYRITRELQAEWGGVFVTDGWIQRSGMLPTLRQPERFLEWFEDQKKNIGLRATNN